MSENGGWKPMTPKEVERSKAMPTEEFFVGASGRPARNRETAVKSIEAANAMQPQDVTDYLRTLVEDDATAQSSLNFSEKYDLKRAIGLLAQLPKQNLPDGFKRVSAMLEGYSRKVKDPAKLDQVRHYLDNFGGSGSKKQ
jgi:hypothetical protein